MSDKLKNELKELQTELKQIDSPEPKLQQLAGDIDAALEQIGDNAGDLLHSLQRTAEEFEAHHPQLTALVNNIMTSLSNMGI